MFSDRHYPTTFLSGNRSLRDMFTVRILKFVFLIYKSRFFFFKKLFQDPEEYDRRMAVISKRNDDTQKSVESRNSRIKDITERRSRQFYGQASGPVI